jgi:hypothetical protein
MDQVYLVNAGFGGATAKKYTALFSLEQFIFIKS